MHETSCCGGGRGKRNTTEYDSGGAMPLDLLQERVEAWIKDQKLNGATAASDMAGKAVR